MSTATTTGQDLLTGIKVPQVPQVFTTFAAGHFVKPGEFTQPVPVKPLLSPCVTGQCFGGWYSEVFTAAPLDLDYDEPNAVVESELEVIVAGEPVHHLEVNVVSKQSKQLESAQPESATMLVAVRNAA